MDYKKHYNALIKKRKKTAPAGYVERHHVVPRCIGGGDVQSNIVALTAREHFVAHMLLWKMHPDQRGLVYAASMMANRFSRNKNTSRLYAALRENLAEQQSEFRNEKSSYFQSQEYKQKVSKSVSGLWKSDDSVFNSRQYREKLSAAQTARWDDAIARNKRSQISKKIWRDNDLRNRITKNIQKATRTEDYRNKQRLDRLGYKRSALEIEKTSGEKNGNSKLSKDSVIEIRRMREVHGLTLAKLSELFGISITNAGDIVNRKIWKHV